VRPFYRNSHTLRQIQGEAMTDTVAEGFAFQRLDVYVAARELAVVVHAAQIGDAELRDQATRAVKSVFLNVAEGLPAQAAGVRRRHFSAANGSLHEVVAAVDLAAAIGAIATEPAKRAQALALRVKQMLWRLISPARAA
jgi:four helix bundle protein